MFEWLDDSSWYYLRAGIEILLIFIVIERLLTALERISAGGKLRGISLALALLVLAAVIANLMQLRAITWLLQTSIGFVVIVLVVVFQPELRRLLTRLGGIFPQHDAGENARIIDHLIDAITFCSANHIGALIVIERSDRLDDYISAGPFDCEVTTKSLTTIFWKDTPLHDGAVIIRNGRVAAAGVILPLTENFEYKHLSGTRHRAGIGISEDTDALALLVSEETGDVSMADRGKLTRGLSRQDLEILLRRLFGPRGGSSL